MTVHTVREFNNRLSYWLLCAFVLSACTSLAIVSPWGMFIHWYFTMPLGGTLVISSIWNAYLINLRGNLNGAVFWTSRKSKWWADFLQTICKWTWIFFLFQMALVGLSCTGDAIFLDITWVIALKDLLFDLWWIPNQTLMLLTSFSSLFFTKFRFFLSRREMLAEFEYEELELERHLESKKREGWIAYQKRKNHLPDELFVI